jgi:hypothetical protein
MLTLSTFILAALLGACGTSASALQDASHDWQRGQPGQRTRARNWARAELLRFQEGNDLADAALDAALQAAATRLDADLPLVADGDHAPTAPRDGATGELLRALHADLLAPGATRVLRAIRTVRALALAAFGPELLTIVANRAPYTVDGPLLRDATPALRSVAVKRYAVEALDALDSPGSPR